MNKSLDIADNYNFFIIYPVNLEDLGLIELKEKFKQHFPNDSLTILKTIPGGIEIECSLVLGFKLNTILRGPTRILLRLAEFKCRDAPKLFQKASKFSWSPWMIGQTPTIESSSTNSRLFDSRKIEKALSDGINQYYKHQPVKKKYLDHLAKTDLSLLPTLYFRAVDDVCTISLDTTGERLHLRGDKLLTGLAPIRENLASLLLTHLTRHLNPDKKYTLIDPMCGSGTFLLEAYQANAIAVDRPYSFQHIPLYLDRPLTKKVELNFVENKTFTKLVGFDIDSNVVSLARSNCQGRTITISEGDIFETKPVDKELIESPVVILNPPYGIRVGENINLAYFVKLISSIKMKFNPERLGMIIPADYLLKSSSSYKVLSTKAFKNGGIDVVFYVLEFK